MAEKINLADMPDDERETLRHDMDDEDDLI